MDIIWIIIKVFFVSLLWIGASGVAYSEFYVCLSDDVDFHYGKNRMRNRRKKNKNIWRNFLFLDIRKEVVKWHYFLFWIYLISSVCGLLFLIAFMCSKEEVARKLFILFSFIAFLSTTIISFVRYPLYAGNKVRSKKKYRKQK